MSDSLQPSLGGPEILILLMFVGLLAIIPAMLITRALIQKNEIVKQLKIQNELLREISYMLKERQL